MENDLITVYEAAQLRKVTPAAVFGWIKDGLLLPVQRRPIRVERAAVVELLTAGRGRPRKGKQE